MGLEREQRGRETLRRGGRRGVAAGWLCALLTVSPGQAWGDRAQDVPGVSLVGVGESAGAPDDVAVAQLGTSAYAYGAHDASVVYPSGGDRALAFGAAIVPGLLIHGSGSYVLGREDTAVRLLILEGVGLALLAAGGSVIAATGAARDFVGPAAAVTMMGAGLFTSSALADMYSVLAPTGGLGVDPGWTPRLQAELGYRYVYDPQFDYRHFVVNRLHGRLANWRLSPSLWSSPGDANQRFRVELAYRFFGPLPGSARTDGNFLEAEVAMTNHRFPRDEFQLTTFESSLRARWDLATYDPFLAGAFLDFEVGAATQVHDFGHGAHGSKSFTLLLGGFGFGMYLGDQRSEGGYVRAYYDHRHDDFAAGLLLPGLISGTLGHLGLDALYYFTEHLGARAEAQVGSATVVGLSGVFRFGGRGP